jgi:serine/threonine protein kinase
MAIKRLQRVFLMDSDYKEALLDFEREMSYLKTLRHANVVYFFGAGYEKTSDTSISVPFLVTEFMGLSKRGV